MRVFCFVRWEFFRPMGYHPRIECKKIATFQTTRTRRSELWFVGNSALERAILGNLAKYREHHGVKLYAFALTGNHIQFPAHFPKGNRSDFMRDFNSSTYRAVVRHQPKYPGGRLWARRYSGEYLPAEEDIEERFFYSVLQSVQDNRADSIYEESEYNCFEDAINGRARTHEVVRWKEYNDARRWDPKVPVEKFTDRFELRYERLPGYEDLTRAEYVQMMRKKLKARTEEIIRNREGQTPVHARKRKRVEPGSLPKKTKTSGRYDHRPRVLSKDRERRAKGNEWYFPIYSAHREASKKYRKGNLKVKFPKGTYRPPVFTVVFKGEIL